MLKKSVLIPLPSRDFDPTEVAVPWKILTESDIQIIFATPDGFAAQPDFRILNGTGLGLFASILKADKNAQNHYAEMASIREFLNPIKWPEINVMSFDGLLLPGGHAQGMREFEWAECSPRKKNNCPAKISRIAGVVPHLCMVGKLLPHLLSDS